MSHLMTKTTKWHVRPPKTQISLSICPVWSVFTVRMKKAWVLSYPLSAQRRLMRLSLRWAHSHFDGYVIRRLKWEGFATDQQRGKKCKLTFCFMLIFWVNMAICEQKKKWSLKSESQASIRCNRISTGAERKDLSMSKWNWSKRMLQRRTAFKLVSVNML